MDIRTAIKRSGGKWHQWRKRLILSAYMNGHEGGFHIPSSTDITVAIRSQFLLSKPLKFTPRRSLFPIMSMVLLFIQTRRNNNGPRGDTKDSCGRDVRCRRRRGGMRSRCYSRGCSRQTLLMARDGVREGVCVRVCVCTGERELAGREGDKESPFPHTRCLWHFLLYEWHQCHNLAQQYVTKEGDHR